MQTSDIQVLAVQGRNGRGELRRASITSRQQLLDEKEDLFSTLKGASMSASQFCYKENGDPVGCTVRKKIRQVTQGETWEQGLQGFFPHLLFAWWHVGLLVLLTATVPKPDPEPTLNPILSHYVVGT